MKAVVARSLFFTLLILMGARSAIAQPPELVVQTGHAGQVNSVVFSPDGKLLASGSWDKTIKLWEVASGTLLRSFEGHSDRVAAVAFSPNGTMLASRSD